MTIILIIVFVLIVCIIFANLKGKNKQSQLPVKYGDGDFDMTLINSTRVSRPQVAKLLSNYMEISQKESERIIENLPYTFMRNIDEEYAEKLKQAFEITGAKIEIKKSKKKN